MLRLRIIGLARLDEPSPFDGKYVKEYDPSYHPAGEVYDGGRLEVTDAPEEAKVFKDAAEAMACWRQAYGYRWDGEPNRPLTAFTVEIAP
jgi:hypothetical protein